MAHHKSALKRIRQSRKAKIYNRQNKKAMKEAVKAVRESKSFEAALDNLSKAIKQLDRAAAKGVIHKNKAANNKSGLARFVKTLKPANA